MNEKGQALIEVAVFFLALSALLAGLCSFTQWVMVRQKLLIAAKQGALMYSSGHMQRGEVEKRMRDFLKNGTPVMEVQGIQVVVRPALGLSSKVYGLDEAVASYTRPGGWYSLLGADPHMQEKCVIMHAPHYWAPFQPWGGPAVAYGR